MHRLRSVEIVCCGGPGSESLDEGQAGDLASAFKALGDPVRLRLLSMIASAPGGEACACDLVEPSGRSQPTISHHLSILVDAGLIEREKRGRWAWFRVVDSRLTDLRTSLTTPGRPRPS